MRVAVIGAGLAGLGAATSLAAKGHDVTVFEAGDRPGGRNVTLTSKRGDKADAGTQYFHTSYRRARALLRDTGLDKGLATVKGPTRFFDARSSRGHFDIAHNAPWIAPAGWSNIKAAGLIARTLMNWQPAASLNYAAKLDAADAWTAYADPFLRDYVIRPLVRAGALVEPEAARASVAHLMRLFQIVVMTNYLVLPGGIASLAQALAARLKVRYGAPAASLIVERGAVKGIALVSGAIQSADHVVVAVPPAVASLLLPEDWTAEREYLDGIVQPPFALVSFFLDRPLDPKVWSYMLPAGGLVGFFTDAARKAPAMAPSGRSIVQAWPCYPASQALMPLDDADIIERCRAELERYFPGASDWIEEAHVTRHPFAVPLHTVGHQQRTRDFLRGADTRRGVSFCGDYMTGGFTEAALWSAERAAQRIG
ncbi:MAG: hypothetical protein OJF62_002210 [Pseudolabrys sp.]|jgi:protoporphyrinogen oxidase|nr:hypothetical protein [Pseudolabrys sp.]